ncbi:hypothetical protein X926_06305 [Petrotoga sp. HWHPT.55.6.3]|nr:hypothetical protein X926_06305 [Petrotoga sp. HWHPT.55.6.3]
MIYLKNIIFNKKGWGAGEGRYRYRYCYKENSAFKKGLQG